MMHSFHFVCVFCVGFVSITSFRLPPVTEYSYRESTSVELLSLEHPPSYRQRRSDDCSPDHIGVRFTADNNEVKLSLQRNYDINVNAPLFVNINGTITQETLENSENVAVYQDLESGSAVLVQCVPSTRKFELFGTFYNGSEELMIEPELNEGQEVFPAAILDEVESRDAKSKKEQVSQDQDLKGKFTISHHVIYKGKTMRPKESDFILKAGLHPKYRAGTGHIARNKRATTAYQVELLMVADYSAYSFWLTNSSSSAVAKVLLRQFYAFVLNGIDLRYKSLTGSSFTITVLFAGLYIAETASDALWTERRKILSGSVYQVNATAALGDFESWIQSSSNLPGHDHAMLFTAYDLEADGINDVAGLAYLGAACTTSSQSIVEDNFDAQLMTLAAHELGHSLGASHDGTQDGNPCSPTLSYIMSASLTLSHLGTSGFQYNKNLWKFSPCSISYFQTYINTLNSTNCLTTLSVGYNSTALSPYDQQNPGQVYSADTQCRYTQGNESYLCRTIYGGNYTNLCTAFYCRISGSSDCSLTIAAERTTCGDRKWCVAGECVTTMKAPSVNDTCPFGNQPGIVADGQTCTQLVASYSDKCYDYTEACCESCQNVYTGIIGCEYGDKAIDCLAEKCAYYDRIRIALCCKTCYVPPTNTTTTRAPTTTTAIHSTITTMPTVTTKTTTTATTKTASTSTTTSAFTETTRITALNATTTPLTAASTTSTTTTSAAPTTIAKTVFSSTPISITPSTTNRATEQQGTTKTAVTVRLDYNVSSADNLSDSGTYSRYVDIVGESLREYYTRKVGQDIQINIRDIRRGSLIVEYDVVIKNIQTAQVALAKANIDLAAGENIRVGGQVLGVESMVVENMTVPIGNSSRDRLCSVYILIAGGCPDNYKCVVFNNSPMCQPIKTTMDIVPVTVAAAVSGLVIAIAVVALICSLQRRSKNRAKHLADLSNDSSSKSQMELPRPAYFSEGHPRHELSNDQYPNNLQMRTNGIRAMTTTTQL